MNYKTLITDDRLLELNRLCGQTPKGAIVELGNYQGGSLKYLAERFPDRNIIGMDTFEGLPEKDWNESEVHKPGDFNDNSLEAVQKYLKDHRNVTLIKGYFPDSATELEEQEFSFVHIDFDFYEGMKNGIEFFYPRLVKGGIIVCDDFDWPNCPGVKKALDESGLEYEKTNAKYQAYIKK